MPFILKAEQLQDLRLISQRSPEDVVEICKLSYEYLINGISGSDLQALAQKFEIKEQTMEALISLFIDATKSNATEADILDLQRETKFQPGVLDVLAQFLTKKRRFIESSIKSANLRSYRIVNIEWRLETRIASRCLLKQNNVFVTMKFYLHTEPKNENRDLLPEGENTIIPAEERRNRKDIIVQTDCSSLLYLIKSLEDALMESKTRRIRNIVKALH